MSTTNPYGQSSGTGGKLGSTSSGQGQGNGSGQPQNAAPKPGQLDVRVAELAPPNRKVGSASVEVTGPQPGKTVTKKSTDGSGKASFPNLKPGNYGVVIKHDKYVTERGAAAVSSNATTDMPVQVRPAKQLKMQFCEHVGGSHPSVLYELWVGGAKVFEEDSFTGKVEVPFTDKNGDSTIDETLTEATLVVQVKRRGVRHGKPQKIQLHFDQPPEIKDSAGKLDPGALQRVLTNLGYEPGAVDGSWSPATQTAVRAFQADMKIPVSGIPDAATVGKLIQKSENPYAAPGACPKSGDALFTGAGDPDLEPAIGKDKALQLGDFQWYEKGSLWPQYEGYIERAAPFFDGPASRPDPAPGQYRVERGDETGVLLFDMTRGSGPEDDSFDGVPDAAKQKPRFFPTEAYVQLAEKGDSKWKNAVWMLKYRTTFMDCGGWVNSQRSFGVILGWHAYLCTYLPPQDQVATVRANPIRAASGPDRMDHEFFSAFSGSVEIQGMVSAVWADKSEFDWQNLVLIFPDFHMMTAIAGNVWKSNNADATGPFYDLSAEVDFYNFVVRLTQEPTLAANIKPVQLGDTYDLWVGSPAILGHDDPLFQKNKKSSLKLRPATEIKLPSGKSYAAGGQEIVQRWKGCFDGDPDVGGRDMRVAVLQWWIEAIQGRHDCPLEQQNAGGRPANINWVQWILQRRSSVCAQTLKKLGDLDQRFLGGQLTGKQVAIELKTEWPAEYENLPDGPTIVGGTYMGFEPEIPRVRRWLACIATRTAAYDASSRAFAKYVEEQRGGDWINPAEVGLKLLEQQYGGLDIIYGNHDDYMILPDVVAGVTGPRKRYLEMGGVFIEHAHRIEPSLAVGSANYDGCWDGFELTNSVWRDKYLDAYPAPTGMFDVVGKARRAKDMAIHKGEFMDPAVVPLSQVTYKNEAGRFLVGRAVMRKQVPHIFVIGHTHGPVMHLDYVHLNDASDIKGPGVLE